MKSFAVHFLNKYPGGHVDHDENRLEAYDSAGVRRVSLRLNGNGQIIDAGKETGAKDQFDMSPIPKNTRVHKLMKDGSIGLDEKHAERKKAAANLSIDRKIHSIGEIEEAQRLHSEGKSLSGLQSQLVSREVDKDGNVSLAAPAKAAAASSSDATELELEN